MSIHRKAIFSAILFFVLAACGDAEPALTPDVSARHGTGPNLDPQAVGVTATPVVTATVPAPTSEAVKVPPGSLPTIDGVLASDEWANAALVFLSDGSELLLMQDDDYLYLGVRSATPEMIGANVFVAAGEQVMILHASAALGTAVYQKSAASWRQTQDFDWRCRNTGNSAAAQAERAAYLQENHWLAANSRMGTPDELEYQIARTDTLQQIAVSVFRTSAPDERIFWPPTLGDDTIRPTPDGLPAELHFSPEQWASL